MKLARILMLSLGLAVFAVAASAEPVVAQCWDCQFGHFPGSNCANCVAGQSGLGVEECSTPACRHCNLEGNLCVVVSMLDGRDAPAGALEQFESPVYTATIELHALGAAYGSVDFLATPRRAGEIRRSCDGGIISKRYAPAAVSAIRSETAQLRL